MDNELTRREFLQVSGGAGLATVAGARLSWGLTSEERGTLLAVVRTVFRHDHVGDDVYSRAVSAIEDRCRDDPTVLRDVTGGVAALDRLSAGRFAGAPDQTRSELLRSRMDTPFFRTVYGEALESLYGSPDMWRMFIAPPRRA